MKKNIVWSFWHWYESLPLIWIFQALAAALSFRSLSESHTHNHYFQHLDQMVTHSGASLHRWCYSPLHSPVSSALWSQHLVSTRNVYLSLCNKKKKEKKNCDPQPWTHFLYLPHFFLHACLLHPVEVGENQDRKLQERSDRDLREQRHRGAGGQAVGGVVNQTRNQTQLKVSSLAGFTLHGSSDPTDFLFFLLYLQMAPKIFNL